MRLKEKVAIVVGAGQTPGDTIGNGRATAILFAREGAKVMLVDRDLDAAKSTEAAIAEEGGEAKSFQADITKEADCQAMAEACVDRYGRIDILHNNVGIGAADGDTVDVSEEVWDLTMAVNLKGMFLTCKYVLPVMRKQESGVITNISSTASLKASSIVAYKTSKGAVNTFTHALAMGNARYGIRANAILPGLMDTPMAIEGHSQRRGIDKDALRAERDAEVPLKAKMGTAWDTAYAALFLASDEARFITGVLLPVDGGQSARVG